MNTNIFERIETPAVLLDAEKLLINIRNMQDLANQYGLNLCPHIKTHKSLKIANLQIGNGATGVTASKVDEALVFVKAEIRSVTVAHPVLTPSKLDRLFASAREYGTDLRLITDSQETMDAVAQKAREHQLKVGIFVKIDVGLHRCGLQEGDERILSIAKAIHTDAWLRFCGLLSHAGHGYGASDKEGVTRVAEEERLLMRRIKETIEQTDVPVPEISVGSTPTVLATERFDGITEIRPGNYVFLDQNPIHLGVARAEAVAFSVLATVISKNSDYLIIDAGSKTLASDQGAHGSTLRIGFGVGYTEENYNEKEAPFNITKLSEEHGFILRNDRDLPLGAKIRIIPNHSCPVANLAGEYLVITESGIKHWPIEAAGLVK